MRKFLIISMALFFIPALCVSANTVSFYDLSDYGWATASVCRLAEKGIIKGTAPHYYSPGNYVSKADLCTLLCRIFRPGGSGLTAFPDTPADSYYYESVAALKALGILQPEEDGGFHPHDASTREFTMRITGFLLERYGFVETADITCLNSFPDKDELLEENRLYAAILVEKGFILGDNHGMLNPGGYLTRAEVAVILDRLYSSLF